VSQAQSGGCSFLRRRAHRELTTTLVVGTWGSVFRGGKTQLVKRRTSGMVGWASSGMGRAVHCGGCRVSAAHSGAELLDEESGGVCSNAVADGVSMGRQRLDEVVVRDIWAHLFPSSARDVLQERADIAIERVGLVGVSPADRYGNPNRAQARCCDKAAQSGGDEEGRVESGIPQVGRRPTHEVDQDTPTEASAEDVERLGELLDGRYRC
jgi:hypothetical protein